MTKNRCSNHFNLKNIPQKSQRNAGGKMHLSTHSDLTKKGQDRLSKNHTLSSKSNGESRDYAGMSFASVKARLNSLIAPFGKDCHQVETPSCTPLFNGLMRLTTIENPDYKDGVFTFVAPRKQRAQIIALINSLCYNHTIVGTRSIPLAILSVLKRTGLVAGLFCAICVLCLYNSFILQVQVDGFCNQNVMDVLAQNRVIKGIFAPSFDGNKVERQLLSLEGVSFASVEKRGTRVYVRVVGELAPDAYVDVGEGGVTASFDGIVTRIIVFSGTAEVQVGDVVTKGQTLIGDYYLKGEDKIPVNPAGEVYGQRVVTVERFFPSQHMAYSGRTKTISRMGVFGHTKPPTPPYEDYEVKVEKVNNNFLLPYSVTRWTYYEISLVDNNLSPEDMMAVAYGEAVAEGNFGQVISHSSTIDEVAGGHLVKTVLTVEEKL